MNIRQYLRTLSINQLVSLSTESTAVTFETDSNVRTIIDTYLNSGHFYIDLINLRNGILIEMTNRVAISDLCN